MKKCPLELEDGKSVPDFFHETDKTSPIFMDVLSIFNFTANITKRIVYQSVPCIILTLIFNIFDAPPAATGLQSHCGWSSPAVLIKHLNAVFNQNI
jgi:hypothetical protein